MRRPRIVVVGSSNTDMVVRTPRIPAPGETILGGDFLMSAGGKGANQAVAASRLGGDVAFVARVGDDVFGDRALAAMSAAGVVTRHVLRTEQAASGVALICLAADGQNSIVVAPGANARLSPEDVTAARPVIHEADIVVVQLEVPLDTVRRTIEIAKERRARVVLNPAPAQRLDAEFLEGVDVITPNEIEAASLAGEAAVPTDPEAMAARLLSLGPGTAVITTGPGGAVYAENDVVERVSAPAVRAVDTTAAGDCFTGALAVALGEGHSTRDAVVFANAAAAISVTRLGAQSSLPSRAAVYEAMGV